MSDKHRDLTFWLAMAIIVWVLAFALALFGPSRVFGYTYDRIWPQKAKVAWDHSGGLGVTYDIRLRWTEATCVCEIAQGIPERSIEVVAPRTGEYAVLVRACNDKGCSPWADSSSSVHATVNGQPMGWVVLWRPGAPGAPSLSLIINPFGWRKASGRDQQESFEVGPEPIDRRRGLHYPVPPSGVGHPV